MESFQKFLNRVGRTYGQADKRFFGGMLPGGSDSPLVTAPQSALSPSSIVRSAPFQAIRDAALEKSGLPKPEQFYIKGMTGGSRDITTMTPEEVSLVKGAYEQSQNSTENPGPVVSLYGQGRNMKMAYGNLSVYPQPGGGVEIYDRWKVDKPEELYSNNPNARDSIDSVADLGEGGPIPSLIYNAANALGTYEPFDIRVNVSPQQWQNTKGKLLNKPKETEKEQGFILNYLNNLYLKGKFGF
jgi:hypothetical protein